jgi:hypothetical protein
MERMKRNLLIVLNIIILIAAGGAWANSSARVLLESNCSVVE